MTIFLNFYIIFYLISMIQLQFLLKTYFSNNLMNSSISYFTFYVLKFSKIKSIILILFFLLSGIPPYIFFFIKFNFLINLLYKINFIYIIIIFLIFFSNMLFYIQIFLNKNTNYQIKIMPNVKNKIFFNKIYIIIFFLLFNLFSVFFFSDLFFILNLIYNWQHLINEYLNIIKQLNLIKNQN